jgi:hypothetical protein
MKSEEPSHSSRNNVGKSGESVPIATAQVFSNYVLVPAARHPGEAEASARLHGTALLVFGDESAEKVQLRTGYATHVAGDLAGARAAARRSGKDAGDEIVSRHDAQPPVIGRKETSMIACSVCHTVIQPGSTSCPGCGLALVAQAVPVVRARASIWPYIIGGIALFILFANTADRWQRDRDARAQANLVSDLGGASSTPAAFQSRCGAARWTAQAKDGVELHYLAGGNDYYVTFAAAGPRFESGHVIESNAKTTAYRVALDPTEGMRILGCK